jgi:hypothetical protein
MIVGMHRSGTSCMAGILHHSGLYFGDKLLPPSAKNPKGYFENEDLWKLHHSILRAVGHPWDDTRPMPAGWEKKWIVRYKKFILKTLITKHFLKREVFGIKDPTINLLLPIYLDVFKTMSIEPCFIVMKRDEAAVARSLSKAEGLGERQTLSLRNMYYESLNGSISGHKRVDMQYETLIEQPAPCIDRINRELQTSFVYSDNGFLDPSLNHAGPG